MPPTAPSNSNSYLRLLVMVWADDSTEFSEIVGNEDAQTPFASIKDRNLRDGVSDLLEVLDGRERKIIFQRFGLADGKPKTLEAVGRKFGLTRERIRQIQNIALTKLRGKACRSAADGSPMRLRSYFQIASKPNRICRTSECGGESCEDRIESAKIFVD
jgi:hypothetical protein